jgi:hypothetical protein
MLPKQNVPECASQQSQPILICTPYVKTWEQIADILTKEVPNSVLHSALCKLGMRDIFALSFRGSVGNFLYDLIIHDLNLLSSFLL